MREHLLPTEPEPPTVVVLVGNPRPGSRTLAAGVALADAVAAHVGGRVTSTIDLATLANQIFAVDHPNVDLALATVEKASIVVVATPVYKASYTGLLKAFLDGYGPDGLAGVVAVPLVVSGNPGHALVGEVHLRPVLVELGAVVPARTLVVTEGQLGDLPAIVNGWLGRSGDVIARAAGVRRGVPADVAAVFAGGVR